MDVAFPYGFDRTGATATADTDRHIRDLIEQVLFTAPGERVNRPTFGTGTAQLVFAPNSDTLAIAQQKLIQAGLQQWLSDLIQVQSVVVENDDATLQITVRYTVSRRSEQQTRSSSTVGGAVDDLLLRPAEPADPGAGAPAAQRHRLSRDRRRDRPDACCCSPSYATGGAAGTRRRSRSSSRAARASPASGRARSAGGDPQAPNTLRRHGRSRRRFLHLHAGAASPTRPPTNHPPGVDPALAQVAFSFKAGCPATGDCAAGHLLPARRQPTNPTSTISPRTTTASCR